MKKWNENVSGYLDALGGNRTNPLDEVKSDVQNADNPPAPVVPVPETGGRKRARKAVSYQITSMHVESSVYKKFKQYAVKQDRTITELLTCAMKDMIEGRYRPERESEK